VILRVYRRATRGSKSGVSLREQIGAQQVEGRVLCAGPLRHWISTSQCCYQRYIIIILICVQLSSEYFEIIKKMIYRQILYFKYFLFLLFKRTVNIVHFSGQCIYYLTIYAFVSSANVSLTGLAWTWSVPSFFTVVVDETTQQ
jgi:hypothetical protein